MVYFYPRDYTPGCTLEACGFRDRHEAFREAGATVVGVSGDRPERHRSFVSEHGLPFTLLSDLRGEARRAYGVKRVFGVLPERVTFVVDPRGIVRHVFSSQIRARRHIEEALAGLERIAGASA